MAIALVGKTIASNTGAAIELVDYQVPLKARQGDRGLGKVDIFGVDTDGRHVLVELKVAARTGRSDSPLRALLESITYGAVLWANRNELDEELAVLRPGHVPPSGGGLRLVIAGPADYWAQWAESGWLEAASQTVRPIARLLGLEIAFVDLGPIGVEMGLEGERPELRSGEATDGAIHAEVLASFPAE